MKSFIKFINIGGKEDMSVQNSVRVIYIFVDISSVEDVHH